jgi:ubiquitin
MTMARKELAELDQQIEEELAKVKDRLAELQAAKKAARQMYDAACMRLGIQNDLAQEDADVAEMER